MQWPPELKSPHRHGPAISRLLTRMLIGCAGDLECATSPDPILTSSAEPSLRFGNCEQWKTVSLQNLSNRVLELQVTADGVPSCESWAEEPFCWEVTTLELQSCETARLTFRKKRLAVAEAEAMLSWCGTRSCTLTFQMSVWTSEDQNPPNRDTVLVPECDI